MEIVPVRPEHADQLLAIYVARVAGAPHCCLRPDLARFCNDLLGLAAPLGRLNPAPHQSYVFVAEESGTARGFATLATYHDGDDDGEEHQAITGLFFVDESAGHALIRACEVQASGAELGAFPNTHGNTAVQAYNGGWDGLSDRVPGVARVLIQHGYFPHWRELHLTAPLPLPHVRRGAWPLPPSIAVTVSDGYRGTCWMQALDGGARLASAPTVPWRPSQTNQQLAASGTSGGSMSMKHTGGVASHARL